MNLNLVDSLLETVFFGGEEGGLEDQPRPRFKWKPPGGAGAPAGEGPGDFEDFADMDIPPRGGLGVPPKAKEHYSYAKPGAAAVPPPPSEPDMLDDRTGKYTLADMLPKSEMGTTDDLLDFFNRIKQAKGKAKKSMQREFDVRRQDFESMLHQFVDKLLTETVCDGCGQEVGDRFFADKSRNGAKVCLCGNCYMKNDPREDSLGREHFDDYEDATLGASQSNRIQSR